jgi:hypothetical protein
MTRQVFLEKTRIGVDAAAGRHADDHVPVVRRRAWRRVLRERRGGPGRARRGNTKDKNSQPTADFQRAHEILPN